MPFINPDNSQSSTDSRKIFIGRTDEIDFFVQSILQPEKPSHNIVSISGNAGVGKSTLLTQFAEKASMPGFKEYCLIARVDKRQATAISMMEKFAYLLSLAGHPLVKFDATLHKYKEKLWKSQPEPAPLLEESAMGSHRSLSEHIDDDRSDAHVFQENSFYNYKGAEQIKEQIGEITAIFVEELNRLANTPLTVGLRQERRQRRLLLFFDPFEQLANEAVPWLLDHFLEMPVSTNIILIIAGQSPLERSSPQHLRSWLPYRTDDIIHSIALTSFSQEETCLYLAAHSIIDQDKVDACWKLSKGLPMYLCHLVANPQRQVDPTKDVVDAILSGISDNEEMKRRLALDVSLFSKAFNQDDLEALNYISEHERPVLYQWLISQHFIISNPLDGRYTYHELTQEMFCRYLYQSPQSYQITRKNLADYYQRLLERTPLKINKEASCSPEWLELMLALITQLFFLPDETDHIHAIEQILHAYEHTDREQDGEIFKALDKLSQEKPANQVSLDARQIALNLQHYITPTLTRRSQQFLDTASYLLEKIAKKPSFPAKLRASIYCKRGRAYHYYLAKNEQAFTECNLAIESDAAYTRAYILRGEIHNSLSHHKEALADFRKAHELNPKNARTLFHLGKTYRLLKHYEDALLYLEHALELGSAYEYSISIETGFTLYSLRRYHEAIGVFLKAIAVQGESSAPWIGLAKAYRALQPSNEIPRLLKEVPISKSNSPKVIASQAEALAAIQHYEYAIENFTQAIQLAPKNTHFLRKRGDIYKRMGHLEEALADFTHAIEIKPDDASMLAQRGEIYGRLNRYEEALRDFQRALNLDRKNGRTFLERGIIYKQTGKFQEALQDFDRAIELDPRTRHAAYEEKGVTLRFLRRDQEAIEALTRSLDAFFECSRCWGELARTYSNLYHRKEIPRLLKEIPLPEDTSDSEIASIIASRSEALRENRYYEEALIDLDYALELDATNVSALFFRGNIYYATGHYEEALYDFEYIIELNLDYKHAGYQGVGQSFLVLKRYREAIDSFLKALTVAPTCKICWGFLVRIYEALYPRSEVPGLLREVSPSETSTASVLVSRANALEATGYIEEALTDFVQAISLSSDHIEAFFSRGQTYSKLKRFEEALADFEHILVLEPRSDKVLFHRGQVHYHLGHYVEAIHDFDQVKILNPQMKHEALKAKALVFLKQQKKSKAIDTLVKALNQQPTCRQCWLLLIRSSEALYSHEQVLKLLQTVNISDINRAVGIDNRVEAMREAGYYNEALDEINRAIITNNVQNTHLESLYLRKGLILSSLKKYAEAIECYKYELIAESNSYSHLYNTAVAAIYWQGATPSQKMIDDAHAALKNRLYTDNHGEALYGLGGLEALLGNPEQALRYLQLAILSDEHTLYWARNDIAWLTFHENQHFQKLISDDGRLFAYFALKAQTQESEDIQFVTPEQEAVAQSSPAISGSIEVSAAVSALTLENSMHKPLIARPATAMQPVDINRLEDILAKHAASSFEGSRQFFKALLSRANLPQRWILETADVWTGNANHDAHTLIRWSVSKGINPTDPQYTTLGSLLEVLLPDVGLDDARVLAALVVVYHLYLGQRQRESIAMCYQVPLTTSVGNQQSNSGSTVWLGPMPTDDLQLQSWLKPEPDLQDVGLLVRAIEQAAAVCRIELPHEKRFGTGFLVAPNLVLTNYHVLKNLDGEDLDDNARLALLRFGYTSATEGQSFRLVESRPVLQSSPADKLDYVLLQVEDKITHASGIKHIQYSLQPLHKHMGLNILQHPKGETMKLAINSNGVFRVHPEKSLVHYVTQAREGSSGSPCFDENWDVVAVHHAEQSTAFGSVREGILFSSIYEKIKEYI